MKNIKIGYLIVILLFSGTYCLAQVKVIPWGSINEYVPSSVKYDTIEGDFLLELAIGGYVTRYGEIVKGNSNFIVETIPFSKESYLYGYFILRDFVHKWLAEKSMIDYNLSSYYSDSTSFKNNFNEIYAIFRNSLVYVENNFNPIYGSYYKRFRLKVEVMYLADVEQRIPLFAKGETEY